MFHGSSIRSSQGQSSINPYICNKEEMAKAIQRSEERRQNERSSYDNVPFITEPGTPLHPIDQQPLGAPPPRQHDNVRTTANRVLSPLRNERRARYVKAPVLYGSTTSHSVNPSISTSSAHKAEEMRRKRLDEQRRIEKSSYDNVPFITEPGTPLHPIDQQPLGAPPPRQQHENVRTTANRVLSLHAKEHEATYDQPVINYNSTTSHYSVNPYIGTRRTHEASVENDVEEPLTDQKVINVLTKTDDILFTRKILDYRIANPSLYNTGERKGVSRGDTILHAICNGNVILRGFDAQTRIDIVLKLLKCAEDHYEESGRDFLLARNRNRETFIEMDLNLGQVAKLQPRLFQIFKRDQKNEELKKLLERIYSQYQDFFEATSHYQEFKDILRMRNEKGLRFPMRPLDQVDRRAFAEGTLNPYKEKLIEEIVQEKRGEAREMLANLPEAYFIKGQYQNGVDVGRLQSKLCHEGSDQYSKEVPANLNRKPRPAPPRVCNLKTDPINRKRPRPHLFKEKLNEKIAEGVADEIKISGINAFPKTTDDYARPTKKQKRNGPLGGAPVYPKIKHVPVNHFHVCETHPDSPAFSTDALHSEEDFAADLLARLSSTSTSLAPPSPAVRQNLFGLETTNQTDSSKAQNQLEAASSHASPSSRVISAERRQPSSGPSPKFIKDPLREEKYQDILNRMRLGDILNLECMEKQPEWKQKILFKVIFDKLKARHGLLGSAFEVKDKTSEVQAKEFLKEHGKWLKFKVSLYKDRLRIKSLETILAEECVKKLPKHKKQVLIQTIIKKLRQEKPSLQTIEQSKDFLMVNKVDLKRIRLH